MASEIYSRHLIRIARRQAGLTQQALAGFEIRMRLAPPDTHVSSLAAAEELLPSDQPERRRERERARLAWHRVDA